MGDWIDNHKVLNKKMYTCCNNILGGQFAVTRSHITNTPLHTYIALRSEQKYANSEIDHYIERTWGSLFCHNYVNE